MVWEAVFLLLVLKIPVVYLCVVVWWAIRAEPEHGEPVSRVEVGDTPSPDPPTRSRSWSPRPRDGRRRDRGPRRPAPAAPRVAVHRAEKRR